MLWWYLITECYDRWPTVHKHPVSNITPTHTHIYPGICWHYLIEAECKLTIIGSDHGLSPGRHQAIIWTNDGILLIGHLGTNFSKISSEIHTFSFKKMYLKMSSAKSQRFCLGLHMLKYRMYAHACMHIHKQNIIVDAWPWIRDKDVKPLDAIIYRCLNVKTNYVIRIGPGGEWWENDQAHLSNSE